MQPLTKGVVSGGKERRKKEKRREQEMSSLGSGNMFDKRRRKREWTYYSLDPCKVCDDEGNVIEGKRSGDNIVTNRTDRRTQPDRRKG